LNKTKIDASRRKNYFWPSPASHTCPAGRSVFFDALAQVCIAQAEFAALTALLCTRKMWNC